jgi:epoxyqueuosine reductase
MAADKEDLRRALHELGFDVVRFATVDSAESPGAPAFAAWLGEGFHADMTWLERSLPKRSDPAQVLEGVKSVVLLGVNYNREEGPGAGAIWARYALNLDYHDTMKPGLVEAGKRLGSWAGISDRDYRYYVDTGPVLERSWAAKAGVGFIGKNAMMISREFGNWLFLAAILVRFEIEPDEPVSRGVDAKPIGTLCGKCTRCMDACPTGALPEPGVLDARRCISYQTIENKGVIPRELRAGIGNRIYGCDICAEVCPWNRFAQQARSGLLEARPAIESLGLREILRMTPETFAAAFKGTSIKRLKLRGLLRNACVVAGNQRAVECLPELLNLAVHAEPIVRAHAVWAVGQLGEAAALAASRLTEADATVLAEYAEIG